MIFCLGDGSGVSSGSGYHKSFKAWNTEVSESRYREIVWEVENILDDSNVDARENWSSEWKKVRSSQWAKIAKIPEFDLQITKEITGLSEIDVAENNEAKKKAKELREKADQLLAQAKELESSLCSLK